MKRIICYAVLALALTAFTPGVSDISSDPECRITDTLGPPPMPTYPPIPTYPPTEAAPTSGSPPPSPYPTPQELPPYPPPVYPTPTDYAYPPPPESPPRESPTETPQPLYRAEKPAETLAPTGWGEIYQLRSRFGLILLGGVFFGGLFTIARLGRRR